MLASHEGFSGVADRRESGPASRVGGGEPRRVARTQGGRHSSPLGGLSADVSGASVWVDANDADPLGAPSESRRPGRAFGEATTRAADAIIVAGPGAGPKGLGAVSRGVWAPSSDLGRAHLRGSSSAPLWRKAEGSASPELAAPFWVPAETGRVCLPPGEGRGCREVPPQAKKNSVSSAQGTSWSLKTRRDSRSTPGLGECGVGSGSAFESPLPVSTRKDSMCLAGWHLLGVFTA